MIYGNILYSEDHLFGLFGLCNVLKKNIGKRIFQHIVTEKYDKEK